MLSFTSFQIESATQKAIDTAKGLIQLYDLHRQPHHPVDISPLLAKFDLRFLDLPPTTFGFALALQHKIIIALNDRLSTELTRAVAMHEVGHIACFHPNQLHALQQGQWVNNQLETEATAVAAYTLLPQLAVRGEVATTVEKIAAHYLVPPELVIIRWALFKRAGF